MKTIQKNISLSLAILSIIFAGYNLFQNIIAKKWAEPTNEMVSKWDSRIQSLRDILPPNITRIGYIETAMILNQDNLFNDFDGEEFFLMQYSLAPVALDIGTNQEWIVGNFNNKVDFQPWLDEKLGNYEIQTIGYSLYLIHNLAE